MLMPAGHRRRKSGLFCVALAVSLTISAASARADTPAPDLDCSIGFNGLQTWVQALPGAEADVQTGAIRIASPEEWRVEFSFSVPGNPAHPAATMRKFVKQVTGVWTAQSKGCGFGDQTAFVALMADMKAADKQLTDASRAEVEAAKKDAPAIGGSP